MRHALVTLAVCLALTGLGCGGGGGAAPPSSAAPSPATSTGQTAEETAALADYLSAVDTIFQARDAADWAVNVAYDQWDQNSDSSWAAFASAAQKAARQYQRLVTRCGAMEVPSFLAPAHDELCGHLEAARDKCAHLADHLTARDRSDWSEQWERDYEKEKAFYMAWRAAVLSEAQRLHTKPSIDL